jgi:predicted aspartyl protease
MPGFSQPVTPRSGFSQRRRTRAGNGRHRAVLSCVHFLRTIRVLFALFALVTGPRALSAPFAFSDGLVWVKVEIEGTARPLNFVLDSGAGSTVISLDAASRLGLKLGRAETVAGVDGPCVARRVDRFPAKVCGQPLTASVLAIDLGRASRGCHQPIDGLVGADFFRGRVVQIDFPAHELRLLDRFEPGAGAVPVRVQRDSLCVPVCVGGDRARWVRLDTGCSDALRWVESGQSRSRGATMGIALAKTGGKFVPMDISIGSRKLAAVPTIIHQREIFPGEAGLLGCGVLSKFRVTVDGKRHRVAFE